MVNLKILFAAMLMAVSSYDARAQNTKSNSPMQLSQDVVLSTLSGLFGSPDSMDAPTTKAGEYSASKKVYEYSDVKVQGLPGMLSVYFDSLGSVTQFNWEAANPKKKKQKARLADYRKIEALVKSIRKLPPAHPDADSAQGDIASLWTEVKYPNGSIDPSVAVMLYPDGALQLMVGDDSDPNNRLDSIGLMLWASVLALPVNK